MNGKLNDTEIMARDSANAIHPEELIQAYSLGYFPMAQHRDDAHAVWVLPDERGVLYLEQARAPKKLQRLLKQEPFEIRVDTVFSDVILACAEQAPGRSETWINDVILDVYNELHHLGVAHSVECFSNNQLVGGLYGLLWEEFFAAKACFRNKTTPAKLQCFT